MEKYTRQYFPDRWEVVEIKQNDQTYHRVLGGWLGGYTTGSAWRMSSSIEKIIDDDKHYEVSNSSGSTYFLHKGTEGLSSLTQHVLISMQDEYDIKIVDITSLLEKYGSK